MAKFELVMPKLGESIMEATILKWVKNVGDTVEVDDTILEIATDKVDSEVPSPVSGQITEIRFKEDDVVEIGETIAIIATEVEIEATEETPIDPPKKQEATPAQEPETDPVDVLTTSIESQVRDFGTPVQNGAKRIPPVSEGRFYSPLVRKIAQEEGIDLEELNHLEGTGLHGRVTKRDILAHVNRRSASVTQPSHISDQDQVKPKEPVVQESQPSVPTVESGEVEIVQMDRMRKLIADHMIASKETAAHVTSFVEADVTNIVQWRDKVKGQFLKRHGYKLTFTPLFIEAVVKAIQDFPMINISIDGDKIIKKKRINIGMATAMPNGNLIVPVIKDAGNYSLVGLAKQVNDLAERARDNDLKPEEIKEGTFTITNVGTFGNVMGTPIINQPEVAIMAVGAIRKKPAVVETAYGDLIAVRHMVFLSLSYDHRVVDGYLGGSFLRKVADYLEDFDHEHTNV